MQEKNTIESQAASAIFERKKTIVIGGKSYEVARPTLATLFLVSEIASTMPKTGEPKTEQALTWVIRNGKDYKAICKMIAILLVGAKAVEADTKRPKYLRFFRRSKLDKLSKWIANSINAEEATAIIADLLMHHGISDFFALTTSLLNEKTALSPTREVEETEVIPRGR